MTQQTKFFAAKCLIFFLAILPLQILFAEDSAFLEPSVSKEINAIITARQNLYLKQSSFSSRAEDLDALYKRGNYQLLWLGNAQSARNTADALDLLANAATQGLIQENYDAQMLRTKRGPALTHSPTSYKDLALYDTALSIAVLRYLHDLHYGRVSPQL